MKIKQIKQESISKKTSFDKCLLISVGSKPNQKKLGELKAKYLFPLDNMKGTYLAVRNPFKYETASVNYLFLNGGDYTEEIDMSKYSEALDANIDLVIHFKESNTYKAYIKVREEVSQEEFVDEVESFKFEEEVIVKIDKKVEEQQSQQEVQEVQEIKEQQEVQEIQEVQEVIDAVEELEEKTEIPVEPEAKISTNRYVNGRPLYVIKTKDVHKIKELNLPDNALIAVI